MPLNTAPTVRPPTVLSRWRCPLLEGEPRDVALQNEIGDLRRAVGAGPHADDLVEQPVVGARARLRRPGSGDGGGGKLGRKIGGEGEQLERDDRRADPSARRHYASGGKPSGVKSNMEDRRGGGKRGVHRA